MQKLVKITGPVQFTDLDGREWVLEKGDTITDSNNDVYIIV